MKKIKRLTPKVRNERFIDYPNNEKLMNKINELIGVIERQQKQIEELQKIISNNSEIQNYKLENWCSQCHFKYDCDEEDYEAFINNPDILSCMWYS